MERKGRILSRILTGIVAIAISQGCIHEQDERTEAVITISFSGSDFHSKALIPDEDKISDLTLLIFDGNGRLEERVYITDTPEPFEVSLLKGTEYSIYACANFGYEIQVRDTDELEKVEFHMAYPDEYREGIPMSAYYRNVIFEEDCTFEITLERLMAEINLRIDRSLLSEGVDMKVTDVRIGNCPKKVKPFIVSKANNEDDCFRVGFTHKDYECDPLNRQDSDGLSDRISLYMLENMQGSFSESPIDSDQDKVFRDGDPRSSICSYVEIKLDYSYEDKASVSQPLIYRFYLGEGLNSLDIERNCRYNIIISPQDDGLKGDGWRVDKSGIAFTGTPGLVQFPGDYIRGDIGDIIHLGCELTPSDAPFDIGTEYLEADRAEGIYDYRIDADGHGVILTLTGPGTGLIYMEAGDPINDAALFFIEVNKPL